MIWQICWTLKDTGNSLTPKSVGYSGLPRYRLRYTVARDPAAALAAGIPERTPPLRTPVIKIAWFACLPGAWASNTPIRGFFVAGVQFLDSSKLSGEV